jgi:hypothetical protein
LDLEVACSSIADLQLVAGRRRAALLRETRLISGLAAVTAAFLSRS